MKEIKAAIDIGTNTSHIIIAEIEDGKINSIIYRKKYFTFIAKEGIERISVAAQERLYRAISHFQSEIRSYNCSAVRAVGTEALRLAANGKDILQTISNEYGLDIEIISGEREAELIFKGVKQAFDLTVGKFLIIDIGGGSVEFIECDHGELNSVESIPIGIARLYKTYHKSEPIPDIHVAQIRQHLRQNCEHIFSRLDGKITFIGSAGTFEALIQSTGFTNQKAVLNYKDFNQIYSEWIMLDLAQREQHIAIPVERAMYINVAIILIKFLFDESKVKEIIVSPYALKEGLIIE